MYLHSFEFFVQKGQTFLQVATEQSHRHRVEADLKQLQIIDGKVSNNCPYPVLEVWLK